MDVFRDMATLRTRKAAAAAALAAAGADYLVVPTVMHHYLCKELRAQEGASPPGAAYNAHLGTFTNFVNLLGMCALSVPAGRLPPISVEVCASAGQIARNSTDHGHMRVALSPLCQRPGLLCSDAGCSWLFCAVSPQFTIATSENCYKHTELTSLQT